MAVTMNNRKSVVVVMLGLVMIAIVSATPSHQLVGIPECTIGTDGTDAGSPCKVEMFLGQTFKYNCGSSPSSTPQKFADTGDDVVAMCNKKLADPSAECAAVDVVELNNIAEKKHSNDVFTVEIKDQRTEAGILQLYSRCTSGTKHLFVELRLHPVYMLPSYGSECNASSPPFVDQEGVCNANVFIEETFLFKGGSTLTAKDPSDFDTPAGKICTTDNSTAECKSPATWAKFLGLSADPIFDTITDGVGVKFVFKPGFSEDVKVGYLKIGTANFAKLFRGIINFYNKRRPGSFISGMKECNTSKCDETLIVGESILLNCTGSTSTVPTAWATTGEFCANDPDTAANCPKDEKVDPRKVGVEVGTDTIKQQYVTLKYTTRQVNDTTLWFRCVGGANAYNGKVVLKNTGGPGPDPSDASSVLNHLSAMLMICISAIALFNIGA